MKYSKKNIGEELKIELEKGYNVIRISNWAHDLFFYSGDDFSSDAKEVLQNILLMEAGPEFEYSEQELKLLAERLMKNTVKIHKDKVILGLSKDELGILSNALNEVCNCIEVWEFETRMGISIEEARIILESLTSIYKKFEPPFNTQFEE